MMKKLLLSSAWLLAALLAPAPAHAEPGETGASAKPMALVVVKTDGSQIEFPLDGMPKITVADGNLVIAARGAETTLAMAGVARMVYKEDAAAGIGTPDAAQSLTRQGDNLILSALPAGAAVRLYTVAGQLVKAFRADGASPVVLSLSSLPSGVYVVECNNQTFKVQKR